MICEISLMNILEISFNFIFFVFEKDLINYKIDI